MDSKELRQLLSQEEDAKLEFKRQLDLRHDDVRVRSAHWDGLIKDILALTNGNVGTADRVGYLVIGAGDELRSDGTRELFDVREQGLRLSRQMILERVNASCRPPIQNIYYSEVQVERAWLAVIAIPPSRFVDETTRPLQANRAILNEGTVFVRRADGIYPASTAEREALNLERGNDLILKRRGAPASRVERFVLNEPLLLDETRYYEFKEIKGTHAIDSIRNTADEYVVAFLNNGGGRIYWGVRDSDRVVVGVQIKAQERDELRKAVVAKLHAIQPAIAPSSYRVSLHPVYDGDQEAVGLFVVEIVVPRPLTPGTLYFTGGNEAFVKTDSGKKKLSGPELQDEILRRSSAQE